MRDLEKGDNLDDPGAPKVAPRMLAKVREEKLMRRQELRSERGGGVRGGRAVGAASRSWKRQGNAPLQSPALPSHFWPSDTQNCKIINLAICSHLFPQQCKEKHY